MRNKTVKQVNKNNLHPSLFKLKTVIFLKLAHYFLVKNNSLAEPQIQVKQ